MDFPPVPLWLVKSPPCRPDRGERRDRTDLQVDPERRPHLAHEVRDDAVEGRPLVAEALLSGAQHPEVLRRLGNHVGAELRRVSNMAEQRPNKPNKLINY